METADDDSEPIRIEAINDTEVEGEPVEEEPNEEYEEPLEEDEDDFEVPLDDLEFPGDDEVEEDL